MDNVAKWVGNGVMILALIMALLGLASGSQGCASTGTSGSVATGPCVWTWDANGTAVLVHGSVECSLPPDLAAQVPRGDLPLLKCEATCTSPWARGLMGVPEPMVESD